MEPITLCGAFIVIFGLWVEFEPIIQRILNCFPGSRIGVVNRPWFATTRKFPRCCVKSFNPVFCMISWPLLRRLKRNFIRNMEAA